MKVPFLDLDRHHRPYAAAFRRKFDELVKKSDFILGKEVAAFEKEFAAYTGVKHAIGVSNGTDALRLACEAIGLRPGDEVLVPANTFIATALGVTKAGATPRFVDVDPNTFNLDPEKAERAITPNTRAIMPVHLFGLPADLDRLLQIANARGLRIIEDAAQAHGATVRGKRVGSFGDLGCFSFYPSKNLGALGDGGMVVTSNDALAERIRMLRHMGQRKKYVHEILGHNNRLDNLQAAFLRMKLKRLDADNRKRQKVAARYAKLLGGTPAVLPAVPSGASHVYHIYSIRHPKRDLVRSKLEEAGIGCGVYYPSPVPYQECYRVLGHRTGDFPAAERLSAESLALPMFPELGDPEIEYVVRTIRSVV